MAKVIWTDQAIADIAEIVAWIAPERPRAAIRLAEHLQKAGANLDRFPSRGRLLPDRRRELVVVAPYLIRYRVEDGRIVILEVRHAAREPE